MRRAAKVDANQPEVTKKLREYGATVQPLHTVGKGCPDLLVGYRGTNYLMEIKDGTRAPSDRKLTKDEEVWHMTWTGTVHTVESWEDALAVIGVRVV